MDPNNRHIYFGIGTLVLLLGGTFAVLRYRKNAISKKQVFQKVDFFAFDSPDKRGSGNCMDRELIWMLHELAIKTGYPIFKWINSGARSPYWNTKVGGVSDSSHLIPICKAVDIKASNKTIRDHIVRVARQVGFKRIGVGKTFVHLDIDANKKQYVAWGYPSGSIPEVNPFV